MTSSNEFYYKPGVTTVLASAERRKGRTLMMRAAMVTHIYSLIHWMKSCYLVYTWCILNIQSHVYGL